MEKLRTFVENYGDLHDAVIRKITYLYSKDKLPSTMELTIECMNIQKDDSWELITLRLKGIDAFRFEERNTTNQVIFELQLRIDEKGCFIFDFSPYSSGIKTDDYFLRSTCCVICENFEVIEAVHL
jgi:hypothetical protein